MASHEVQLTVDGNNAFPKTNQEYMSVCLNGRPTFVLSGGFVRSRVLMDLIWSQNGTAFTFTGNGIRINAGVSKIYVSGMLSFYNSPNPTGEVNVELVRFRGGVFNQVIGRTFDIKNTDVLLNASIPDIPIDVVEGDVIYIYFNGSTVGNYTFLGDGATGGSGGAGGSGCFLHCKKIL